jgi:hypothetical protein
MRISLVGITKLPIGARLSCRQSAETPLRDQCDDITDAGRYGPSKLLSAFGEATEDVLKTPTTDLKAAHAVPGETCSTADAAKSDHDGAETWSVRVFNRSNMPHVHNMLVGEGAMSVEPQAEHEP